ncbi:MAG TPA: hypothetical protein VFZ55_01020 [Nitrososphaera sp.]
MYHERRLKESKSFLLYCSFAGFIAAWAISGMLAIIDIVSQTPVGTFFAVIGISLGFEDVTSAQFIGFGLHLLTGLTAGNIYGQLAMFWPKLSPYNMYNGLFTGMIVGIALWAALFFPLATFGIQARLDAYVLSAPNYQILLIASHFNGLYYVILGSAFAFHMVYGSIMGLIASRLYILRQDKKEFTRQRVRYDKRFKHRFDNE